MALQRALTGLHSLGFPSSLLAKRMDLLYGTLLQLWVLQASLAIPCPILRDLCRSKVREAMTLIPRNQFAPHVALPESLSDRPIMTAMGFNISAPHMHAMLLEELDLQPGHRLLSPEQFLQAGLAGADIEALVLMQEHCRLALTSQPWVVLLGILGVTAAYSER